MTEMQFNNTDEAYEYLRGQLRLATDLTIKLMDHMDRLQPNKFCYVRTPDETATLEGSGAPGGDASSKPVFRVIEGGLSKSKD